MELYKAKTYPGKFMDLMLGLVAMGYILFFFLGIVAIFTQDWQMAIYFFILSVAGYLFRRLFIRRLGINIFPDGVDIHYLPQLLIQRGKTIHLSFADVADCKNGKTRFGRTTTSYIIISLKNGKKYRIRYWIPLFKDMNTYSTACEEDITTAFQKFSKH